MSPDNILYARRDFLKAATLLAAVAASANSQAKPKKPEFPFVDGLCLDIFQKPEDIRASGLTAVAFDVSQGKRFRTATAPLNGGALLTPPRARSQRRTRN